MTHLKTVFTSYLRKKNWYEIIYILQGSLRFVKRELSFNILIEFVISIKTVQLIKMCLNSDHLQGAHISFITVNDFKIC